MGHRISLSIGVGQGNKKRKVYHGLFASVAAYNQQQLLKARARVLKATREQNTYIKQLAFPNIQFDLFLEEEHIDTVSKS